MFNVVSNVVGAGANTYTVTFSRTANDTIYTKVLTLDTVAPAVSWESSTQQLALQQNGIDQIHALTQTATEADLKSGNYLAIDGAEGTKRLPADAVAKASDVAHLEYKVNNISLSKTKTNAVAGQGFRSDIDVIMNAGDSIIVSVSSDTTLKANVGYKKPDGTNGGTIKSDIVISNDRIVVPEQAIAIWFWVYDIAQSNIPITTTVVSLGIESRIDDVEEKIPNLQEQISSNSQMIESVSAKEMIVSGDNSYSRTFTVNANATSYQEFLFTIVKGSKAKIKIEGSSSFNANFGVKFEDNSTKTLIREMLKGVETEITFDEDSPKAWFFVTNGSSANSINISVTNSKTIERISSVEKVRFDDSIINDGELPIVTFVYDDLDFNGSGEDRNVRLRNWLNERGLKGSFAIPVEGSQQYGNYKFEKVIPQYKKWISEGHSVLCHGLGNVSVTIRDGSSYNGLSHINDEDKFKVLNLAKTSFSNAGFSSHGFVNYNGGALSPRALNVMQAFFDYNIAWDRKGGYNGLNSNVFKLSRYITDPRNMLQGAKNLVDSAIGKNCLIIFGGHMHTTASGQWNVNNSTEEDFLELLDYIADRVANKQMLAMNCDDAVRTIKNRASCRSVLASNGDTWSLPLNPTFGETRIVASQIKFCSSAGSKGHYAVTFNGTATSNGTITVTLSGYPEFDLEEFRTSQTHSVAITSGMTAKQIVEKFVEQNAINVACVTAKDGALDIIMDIADDSSTPVISGSVSGITYSVSTISNGAAPSWT